MDYSSGSVTRGAHMHMQEKLDFSGWKFEIGDMSVIRFAAYCSHKNKFA